MFFKKGRQLLENWPDVKLSHCLMQKWWISHEKLCEPNAFITACTHVSRYTSIADFYVPYCGNCSCHFVNTIRTERDLVESLAKLFQSCLNFAPLRCSIMKKRRLLGPKVAKKMTSLSSRGWLQRYNSKHLLLKYSEWYWCVSLIFRIKSYEFCKLLTCIVDLLLHSGMQRNGRTRLATAWLAPPCQESSVPF